MNIPMFLNYLKGLQIRFFGCNDSYSTYFSVNFGGGVSQDRQIYFWNDKSNNSGGIIRYMNCKAVLYDRNIMRLEKDNVKYAYELSLTPKSENHTNRTLYLFGVNAEMSEGNVFTFIRHDLRMFSCKIYEDDVLIKDFIPVMYGEKVGLYDNVSKKFHENIGTGEFLYE